MNTPNRHIITLDVESDGQRVTISGFLQSRPRSERRGKIFEFNTSDVSPLTSTLPDFNISTCENTGMISST